MKSRQEKLSATHRFPKKLRSRHLVKLTPAKQRDILIEASKDGHTIRQIRKNRGLQNRKCQKGKNVAVGKGDSATKRTEIFMDWTWEPPDKAFSVSIKFFSAQNHSNRTDLCKKALNAAIAGMDQQNDT